MTIFVETSDDMMIMEANYIIEKKSLAEEVAELLQKQIAGEELKEGDRLPTEPELMKAFGVGRSTIREAVKMLVNTGFLKVRQGCGTFVESKTPQDEPLEKRLKRADIQELNEVRKILETAIAGKAAKCRTEHDIDTFNKYLTERKKAALAGALEECIEADINFHVAVAKATHNTILYELYKSAAIHLQKGFRHIYDDTSDFLVTHPLHEQLVNYIMEGDAQNASDAASGFWGNLGFENK